jgi:hypothetical protein
MRVLNIAQFEELLTTVALRYCTYESAFNELRTVELMKEYWPDCIAKEIIMSFDEMYSRKSFDYALYMNKEKFNNYVDVESMVDDSITEDAKEISLLIGKNAKHYFVKKIASLMSNNPEKSIEYVAALQTMVTCGEREDYFVDEFLDKTFTKNEEDNKSGKNKVIIPDFPIWSEQIGGFNPARVSGISAKSGFGKTKLAVNLADSARKVMPVYYFNMEMSPEDFELQFIQKNAGITYNQFKSLKYGQNEFQRIIDYKASYQSTHRIAFTGGQSLNLDQICAKMTAKMKHGGLAIVDYDQKLIFNASQGEEWMAMVRAMERLEEMAKSLSIHVIVLFQADDDGFAKSSKRAIQPLSSFVNFTKAEDNKTYILKNIKNRFGPTGFEIVMDYWPETTKIEEKKLVDQDMKEIMKPEIKSLQRRAK